MSTLYYVDFQNISEDYSLDTCTTCYDTFEEALEFARTELKCYEDEENLIQATIYEEEHKVGEIIGEPIDIYTISNLDKVHTALIRTQQGYCSPNVNEYLK